MCTKLAAVLFDPHCKQSPGGSRAQALASDKIAVIELEAY